jgi:hypothetical protein
MDSNIFAGTASGLYISTDIGSTWAPCNSDLGNSVVLAFVVNNGNIFAGTRYGVFLSSDKGGTWQKVNTGLTDTIVRSLSSIGHNVFAGTTNGIFLSTNVGANWARIDDGLTNKLAYALTADGTDLFVGTRGAGVWRRPLSELITKTESVRNTVPSQFILLQNYPNPFNPTTTIQYELPRNSKVRLKVYNLLGQVVQTLVNGVEQAGYKQVHWNADGFASGIYFNRLEAASVTDPTKVFTQVRKMVLMK